jgi:hypothetical protein
MGLGGSEVTAGLILKKLSAGNSHHRDIMTLSSAGSDLPYRKD